MPRPMTNSIEKRNPRRSPAFNGAQSRPIKYREKGTKQRASRRKRVALVSKRAEKQPALFEAAPKPLGSQTGCLCVG